MEEHFSLIKERWKSGSSGSDMEQIDDAPMMENELTAQLRGKK